MQSSSKHMDMISAKFTVSQFQIYTTDYVLLVWDKAPSLKFLF